MSVEKLQTPIRTRVEDALKLTLERELAVSAADEDSVSAFTRAISFSKAFMPAREQEDPVPRLADLDDARFAAFMDRMSRTEND